jgi:hypothetical protein
MATHTPGPWDKSGPLEAEAVANARLIASAPDLLAALEQLMEFEGGEAGFYPEDDTQQRANDVWQDALDAIAKATGREVSVDTCTLP